jgi:DNA-binding CsgD family transcriptional regulator
METLSFALRPTSPQSTLLSAYNLWASADMEACRRELTHAEAWASGPERRSIAFLRARTYLRSQRPDLAIATLDSVGDGDGDVDARCTAASARGLSLIGIGRTDAGMRLLHSATAESEGDGVQPVIRGQTLHDAARGFLACGKYREADDLSVRACQPPHNGVIAAQASATRGLLRIGRSRSAEAIPYYREASRRFRACSGSDGEYEASVILTLSICLLHVLDHDGVPEYFSGMLPHVKGVSFDTYRVGVNRLDALRAAIHGDEERATEYAAAALATDAGPYWQTLALVTQAEIAEAFGHKHHARAFLNVAFARATSLDWNEAPSESRFCLLYCAALFASHDPHRASILLTLFTRIRTGMSIYYFGGKLPIQRALESAVRGAIALQLGDESGRCDLRAAYEIYEDAGYHWRAAGVQLVLGSGTSLEAKRSYADARAAIVERFPRSFLARKLHDYCPPFATGGVALTPALMAIVRALCSGKTIRQVAEERSTSLGTVYNQLKEIYRRTDLHSIGSVVAKYGKVI